MAEESEGADDPGKLFSVFLRKRHIKYCTRSLNVLPRRCESFDSMRLMIAFFAISTLDLLDALSTIEYIKQEIIEWVYSLQLLPDESGSNKLKYGFRGSTSCTVIGPDCTDICDNANITMTYTALCILLILGDDLSRVNKECIISSMKELQLDDGSFRPMPVECENDMRFVFCAACICYILQDWSGMDRDKAVHYILSSITYDGGIAQGPGLESHGGSTFCAVASLWLMGRLDDVLTPQQFKNLRRWCVFRQEDGFQGRPNKPTDSCYSFWVGATLKLLNSYHLVDHSELVRFVLYTQDELIGGLAKWVGNDPDALHTYLGISGLSLIDNSEILPVHPALNISQRAFNTLSELHKSWRQTS